MKSILFIMLSCCMAANTIAQGVKVISFREDMMPYSPRGFYVSGVKDDNTDKSTIGSLTDGTKKQKLVLQGGAERALGDFFRNRVLQDKTAQPVTIHASKFAIDIKKAGAGWKVDASLTMAFYVMDKKVMEYGSKGHGEMTSDPGDYVENFFRQALENDLKKFDAWWEKNKSHVATSPVIKVIVTVANTTDQPNLIAYSPSHPLEISEFKGVADSQVPELAATQSGVGLVYSTSTQNGQTVLNVKITPYFDKTRSWFKEEGKNARVLKHEQIHFDITAIKACDLADAIRKTEMKADNFEGIIDRLQRQNTQESNVQQASYDAESNHGMVEPLQKEWEDKVEARLKEISCYK